MERLKFVYRPLICPFDELLNHISADQRVFDIGCGVGTFLLLAAHLKNPKSLGGIEINPSSLAKAELNLQSYRDGLEVNLSHFDGADIPESISNYDVIFLIDVLHHIPSQHQGQFLQSVWNRMAKGAVFILKDIDAAERGWCLFNKIHDLILAGEVGHEISASQAMDTLKNIGFEILSLNKQRVLVYPHYTIVAKK